METVLEDWSCWIVSVKAHTLWPPTQRALHLRNKNYLSTEMEETNAINISRKLKEKTQIFEITSDDTYDLLSFFASVLSTQAWQHMGLRVKPGTDKVEKDFERAKIAIDCTSLLIEKLEPHVEEKDRDALTSLLSDPQINYAKQSLEK